MASTQQTIAIIRNLVALDLLSSVGTKVLVPDPEDVSPPSTLVTFFDVPLSAMTIPPFLHAVHRSGRVFRRRFSRTKQKSAPRIPHHDEIINTAVY